MPPRSKSGAGAIRDIFRGARRQLDELAAANVPDPGPNEPRDGLRAGAWEGAPHDAMPPGCPVTVMGADAEGHVWCRNALGHPVMIEKWDMATIARLFAPQINYAFWAWPAWGKVKLQEGDTVREVLEVKRIERDKLFTCLANEASKKAMFDPHKQLRGRGGWKDGNGEFIWHSGRYLWKVKNGQLAAVRPGEHDGAQYTVQPETIIPWEGPIKPEESPARRILADLRTWNWERPWLDPVLVLGWIGTAFLGEAADVRPVLFTTGGKGVGKSTLHELLRYVLNRVMIQSANTTPAFIYQTIKHDTLPLLLDEVESKAGDRRGPELIELARIAYSGGNIGRGSQEGVPANYTMHSSFMFSAIIAPHMEVQDKSRMARLNLDKVAPGAKRFVVVRHEEDGRMILRQVMEGWQRFRDTLLPDWWNVLQPQGFDSRIIDTFGTLLAMADLLVGPEALEEMGLPVTEPTRLGEIIKDAISADLDEHVDKWQKCLNLLLMSQIDQLRNGKRPTVGGVMDELSSSPLEMDIKLARECLEAINLGCKAKGSLGDPGGGPYLAVPPDGPAIAKVFEHTEFLKGNWFDAMKQAPKTVVIRDRENGVVRINGISRRCLLVDMGAFHAFGKG